MDCKEITQQIISHQKESEKLVGLFAECAETEEILNKFKQLKLNFSETLRAIDPDRIDTREKVARKYGFSVVNLLTKAGYMIGVKYRGIDSDGKRLLEEYLIDEAEESVISGPYYSLDDTATGTFMVSKDKDSGEILIDDTEKVLFDPSAEDDIAVVNGSFHGRSTPQIIFYLYNEGGKTYQRRRNAFLRPDGKVILRNKGFGSYFSEGVAWVWESGKYYLYDENENIIINGVEFDKVDEMEDGKSLAFKDVDDDIQSVRTIDRNGNVRDLNILVSGRSSVQRYGKYCVATKPTDGKEVFCFTIEGRVLDRVRTSSISGYVNADEGIFKGKIGESYFLVNEEGKNIGRVGVFEYAGEYREGFIDVMDADGWHLMDKNGNYLQIDIPHSDINYLSGFYDGICVVGDRRGKTIIDKSGRDILQGERYEMIYSSSSGGVLSVVDKDGNQLYFYRDGRRVFS